MRLTVISTPSVLAGISEHATVSRCRANHLLGGKGRRLLSEGGRAHQTVRREPHFIAFGVDGVSRPSDSARPTQLQQDDQFFSTAITESVSFTEAIFRKAAEIRAGHNFRAPDALHLAVAMSASCDLFLTNDARLKSFPDIPIEVVT